MSILSNKSFYLDINLIFKYLMIVVPASIIIGNFALNLNVLLIDLIFIYFLLKKEIFLKKNILILFLILILFFLTNIFFSSNIFLSIKGSLGIFKFIIFFLALVYFLRNIENKNLFFKFIFYLILFVTIDVLVQYFFGKDFFGLEYSTAHGKRLSGPFGDEYVVGAYLSKLAFLGLIYLDYLKKNHIYFIMYLTFLVFTIFLTQERSAFFITLITFFFFIFFLKIEIKKKIIYLLILPIIIGVFLKSDQSAFDKYYNLTLKQLGFTDEIHYRNPKKSHKIENFWDSRYGAHFLTSYEIFLDNKILGSGVKTFRSSCSLEKYENIESEYSDRRCNTHPHNLYYEILSEGGLLFFIPFCVTILFFFIQNFRNLFKNNNYLISLINLCLLIILFFPIQTTGSFFSSFNGIFYWIALAIILHNMKLNFFRHSP